MGAELNNPVIRDEEMHNDAAGPWGPSPLLLISAQIMLFPIKVRL